MHSAAPQVGRILGQIDGSKPFHDSVVGPKHGLRLVELIVPTRSTPQTLRVKVVESKDVDGSLDAQIVELAVDVEQLEVLVAEMVKHETVDHAFVEDVFVLGKSDVV
jgi:hypothetical protein